METAVALEFRLLGPVQAFRDGRPVALGPPKARALLGYLLLHPGEVVSAERLIDVLWNESPPATAGHAVQVYVAGLREGLEPDRGPGTPACVLRTQRPGYQLAVAREQVDAHRFEALVGQARRWAESGDRLRAAETLRTAAALWRGPALADVAGGSFAAAVQRLDELRMAAIEERVDAELALGRHAELAGELVELSREHPTRERLHGQLMVALYRCGRQADALQVFRDLRTQLDVEGLVPSAELRGLEVAVLRQASELAVPPPVGSNDGAAPAGQGPAGSTAGADQQAAREGRGAPALVRTVSVVHAVMAGPAPDADGDLAVALAEVPDRIAECVQALGGTVQERRGHGLSAVFGHPEPHEDDPERAVRAALDAAAELGRYGRRIAEAWGVPPPEWRFGVCTGSLRPGLARAARAGPVTAAARLAERAATGSVLVDVPTRRLVEAQFVWATPCQETEAGEVRAPRPGPGRARGLPDVEIPLVGRVKELAAGLAVVEGAQAGNGGLLWVTGEVGVGKSRLLTELRTRALDGARPALWLQGNCLSYGDGLAHWPIRELVHDWLGTTPQVPELRVRARLRSRIEALLGRDALDAHLGLAGLLDLRPDRTHAQRAGQLAPEARERLISSAVRAVLTRLAEQSPVVVAIEDVHWADDGSLRLLEALLDCTEDTGIAVLVTQRPERAHPSWRLRELTQRTLAHRTTEIVLGPLSTGEDADLLSALVGPERLEDKLVGRLLAAAEGNPFFLEELVRSLPDVPAGAAERDIGDIPDTVEQVLGSRIGRLSAPAQQLLVTAAVLGRRFALDTLVAVTDQDEDPADALRELTGNGLIVQTQGGSAAEYEFRHALIHEAAYRALWPPRRRALHRSAAEVLDAMRGQHPGAGDDALARHWQQAGDDARAMTSHRLAARTAFTVHALDVAEHHFSQGLAAGRRLGPDVDQHALGDLLLGLGQVGRRSGAGDPEASLAEALATAVACGDAATEWQARYELGFWLGYVRARHGEAQTCFEAAARAARRSGDVNGQVGALSRVSLLLASQLDFVTALGQAEQALRLADDVGDERAQASALDARKLSVLFLGDLAAFEELAPRLEEILRRHDDLWTLQFLLAEAAVVASATGRWEEAGSRLAEADEINRRCGDRLCRPLLVATRAGIERGRGDYGSALAAGAEAVAAAADGAWWGPWARTDLGATLLELHDPVAATEHLRPAAAASMMPAQRVRSLAHLAWARWLQGERGQAGHDLDRAEALLDGMTAPPGRTYLFGADAALACAQVRLARGEITRAERVVAPVVAAAEASDWREPLARGLLLAGRCRRLAGDRVAAQGLAGRALELADRTGLPGVAWRARAVLAGVAPGADALLNQARRGVLELSVAVSAADARGRFVEAALAEVDQLAG